MKLWIVKKWKVWRHMIFTLPCHKLSHFLRPLPPLERDILYGHEWMTEWSSGSLVTLQRCVCCQWGNCRLRVVHGSDGPVDQVGSGHDFAGWALWNFQFFTDYFWISETMWIFEYCIRIGGFLRYLIYIIIKQLINNYFIKLNIQTRF